MNWKRAFRNKRVDSEQAPISPLAKLWPLWSPMAYVVFPWTLNLSFLKGSSDLHQARIPSSTSITPETDSRFDADRREATSRDMWIRPLRMAYLARTVSPKTRLTSQTMLSTGRDSQKCRRPARTPFSRPMFSASSRVLVRIDSLVSSRSLSARTSAVSLSTGHGSGPTPARWTIAPHMYWSPKKGHTKFGRPCRRPAAVVPAPPWWTTAQQSGRSQSWATGPTLWQRRSPETSSLLQLDWTTILVFVALAASIIIICRRFVSLITMLPKPTKTGFSPSASHSMRSLNLVSSTRETLLLSPAFGFRFCVKVPTTRHCSGQSLGFGTKLGDHIALKGMLASTIGLANCAPKGIGFRPRSRFLQLLISVAMLVHKRVSNPK
mmetsp:Transcript_33134/g.69286  ORF Transcript_33134/g.69286 Transcript_33134/m.69286 type:complete len:379 (+) Transcript_33134:627-1763(+)